MSHHTCKMLLLALLCSACGAPDVVGRYFGDSEHEYTGEGRTGTAATVNYSGTTNDQEGLEIRNGSSVGSVVVGFLEGVCWLRFSGFGSSWNLAEEQECTVEGETVTSNTVAGTTASTRSEYRYVYTVKEGELTQSGSDISLTLKMELDFDQTDTGTLTTTTRTDHYEYSFEFDGEKIADM